jgi:DNA helicase-2/ATP-dependent DNA helicase PcrA
MLNLEKKNKYPLNEKQLEGVLHENGPIVVYAGAGSGKTRVIAYRVLNLIENYNQKPESILCITFTNKASEEMKERIFKLVSNEYTSFPQTTTFHGFSLKMIRRFGALINLNNITIIDEDGQKEILKEIFNKNGIDEKIFTISKALSYLSVIKNEANSFDTISYSKKELLRCIYHEYEQAKKTSSLLDFDDLLLRCLDLLNIEEVKNILQSEIRHILVDEYQDTNFAQHNIIKKLSLDREKKFSIDSLCIVGDEDQSIYSWRGANVYNITNFKKDFPETKTITLSQNYRSTKEILSLANIVIKKNTMRNDKELWTNKTKVNSTFLFTCESGYQEANIVISSSKIIGSLTKGTHAILYRSHYQSRLFEEVCISNSVPYKILGGINFYERQEIKDILSYIKISVNGKDKLAFSRCCNIPNRGLGETFQKNFLQFWDNEMAEEDILLVIEKFSNVYKLTQKALSSLNDVKKSIENIRIMQNCSPDEIIKKLIELINYYSHIDKISETEDEKNERKENVNELINAANIFYKKENGTIKEFVDYISIMYNKKIDAENRNQQILLMTLHAAKGLEFNTVFLVGIEENIFPSARSIDEIQLLEEERRLFYVGITRACENLFITHCNQRTLWGNTKRYSPSRFLTDIKRLLTYSDLSQIPPYLIEKELQRIISEKSEAQNINNYSNTKNFEEKFIQKKESINFEFQQNQSSKKFYKNEQVKHDIFGVGRIIKYENDVCEVFFPIGIKKIKSDYLKKIN